jgi:hypothetical protein
LEIDLVHSVVQPKQRQRKSFPVQSDASRHVEVIPQKDQSRRFSFKNGRKYDIISKGGLLGFDEFLAVRWKLFWEGCMRTGVLYAETEEGLKLAVIDVTNPAFTVTATDAELAGMAEQYIREAARQQEIPAELREALGSSMLGRGLMAAAGTYLDGISTYMLKLGPENLGEGATPIDQRIAASFPAFTARLRLQDMAELLADGLALTAPAEPRRTILLVNIGGGPASDSWNALIVLNSRLRAGFGAEKEQLPAGPRLVIAIMDVDDKGPAFGARAIDALRAATAPLGGLDLEVRHFRYAWSEADRLREALGKLQADGAACGISSEGGLFEYGSDAEIVSNLAALHAGTAGDAFVVGSVTKDGGPVRASPIAHRVSTRPRTMGAFRVLVGQTGWLVQEVRERPFSFNVRLVKG